MADGTIAAALIAFVALLVTAAGIYRSRFHARQRLTYERVERLGDLELIEHQAVMSSFLRGGMRPPWLAPEDWGPKGEPAPLAMRVRTWQELSKSSTFDDRKTVLQILALPNMLEALAGMYNQRLLDRGIVKTHVESQARAFWDLAGWWIKELRPKAEANASAAPEADKTNPEANTINREADKIFRDLEKMLDSLAERKRPRRRR